MKIEQIRITPVAFRDPPVLNASGVHIPYALRAVIEVEDSSGCIGLGETYGDLPALNNLIKVKDKLIGLSPYDINALHKIIKSEIKPDISQGFANLNPGTHAAKAATNTFAAFEVAFLDLQAKAKSIPLAELLGGIIRKKVPYSAYLFYKFKEHINAPYEADPWGEALTPEQIVAQATKMVSMHGFQSLKLKAGVLKPEIEIDTILALSKAFPKSPLRIDPNANWSIKTAINVANKLDGVIEYYEDPVPTLKGMGELRKNTNLKLATNMVVTSFKEFKENIFTNSSQVILSDHHFWGGLLATKHLAWMCDLFNFELSMHSNSHMGISLMAMTHLAASTPNLDYACDTHYPWYEEDVIQGDRIQFSKGAVSIDKSKPGLGVELDYEKLEKLHQQYLECGYKITSEQGEYMRKFQPEFPFKKPRY